MHFYTIKLFNLVYFWILCKWIHHLCYFIGIQFFLFKIRIFHINACRWVSFIFSSLWPSVLSLCHNLFIHSTIDGQWGFPVWGYNNKCYEEQPHTCLLVHMWGVLQAPESRLGVYIRGYICSALQIVPNCFMKWFVPLYIPPALNESYQGCLCSIFYCQSGGCEMVSRCGCNLHFFITNEREYFFHSVLAILVFSYVKCILIHFVYFFCVVFLFLKCKDF